MLNRSAERLLSKAIEALEQSNKENQALLRQALELNQKLLAQIQNPVLAAYPVDERAMHTSEPEEEAQWLLDNDIIDKDQYRQLLEEAQFENTEVQLSL